MIQPIKQFRVTRLTISGFKGYADQKTFQFGGMNVISGHMGVGKSSIADAIAFAITGVGFCGHCFSGETVERGTPPPNM